MQPQPTNPDEQLTTQNKSADVLETLVEALAHTDSSVRESAAKEFAKRKDKRGVNFLVEVLNDDDSQVRYQAAAALNELGWRHSDETQQARHTVALQQFQSAVALGEAAIDPLLQLLIDRDAGLRMAAVETLSQIGGVRITKPLIEILKDENPHVRAVAVQVLSRLGDVQAVEALTKMVHDKSWEVRSVVLDALETFNTSRCVDTYIVFLKDESADFRLRAVELLGNAGDVRAITPLVVALVDDDPAVRTASEQQLKKLDANWEKTEYAKGATAGLLPALKHNDDSIRERTADIFRLIGQVRAMNSYLTAEMGTSSNTAVPVLANALKGTNRDLRQAAAEALGRMGDQSAIEHLVEALSDEDQWVREAALYALNLLNWKPANDTELVLKAVILQRWETAVLFDAVAFQPLAMMLNSDNPETCKSVVAALAQIGDKRATEPLAEMMHHPNKGVRAATAQALRTLGWLPKDARESVMQAIELEDWSTVSQHGASAVEPLITTIKQNYQNQEVYEAAVSALVNITDGRAVKSLLAYSRDGQTADAVMKALANLVEHNAIDIESDDLRAMTTLNNIFQFRYTFDARYGTHVRSGMQEVDSSRLKKMAGQELARRGMEA